MAVCLGVCGRHRSYYSIDKQAEKVRAILACELLAIQTLQGVCQKRKLPDYIRLRQSDVGSLACARQVFRDLLKLIPGQN
jgi:hypothetical protein